MACSKASTAVVRIAQVGHRSADGQLVEQSANRRSAERRHPLFELIRDFGDAATMSLMRTRRGVLGKVRQVGQGVRHPLVPDQKRRARELE